MRLREFYQFKQLEAKYASMYALSIVRLTIEIKLKGHLPITVYAASNNLLAKKYSFVWTRFGVVRLLSDDGSVFDKSPLCEQLDEAVCCAVLARVENSTLKIQQ